MKRRLLIIAVFLLLGAVVNVALAWACAAFVPGTRSGFGAVRRDHPRARDLAGSKRPDEVVVAESSGCGHDSLFVVRLTTAAPKLGDVVGVMDGTGRRYLKAPQWESQHITRAGLPLRCLESEVHAVQQRRTDIARSPPKPIAFANGFLLMCPIWPGFALNTLLYAAILWLLIPGPFVLRRFLRLRRGLCPKCAYPMGESAVCTECGGALPSPT